ncbi:hypothetical protein [Chitinophaga sp. CB10]|uniref:hypothetical protein n=1 Tax=Chitinophaga sp. CB10 TaxID=1891659 RepID=UPI0025C4F56A|nr:hypothetical protein [Chitinophaga sp. CB10]
MAAFFLTGGWRKAGCYLYNGNAALNRQVQTLDGLSGPGDAKNDFCSGLVTNAREEQGFVAESCTNPIKAIAFTDFVRRYLAPPRCGGYPHCETGDHRQNRVGPEGDAAGDPVDTRYIVSVGEQALAFESCIDPCIDPCIAPLKGLEFQAPIITNKPTDTQGQAFAFHTASEPLQDVEFISEENEENKTEQGQLPILFLKLWRHITAKLNVDYHIHFTPSRRNERLLAASTPQPRYILYSQLQIPYDNN